MSILSDAPLAHPDHGRSGIPQQFHRTVTDVCARSQKKHPDHRRRDTDDASTFRHGDRAVLTFHLCVFDINKADPVFNARRLFRAGHAAHGRTSGITVIRPKP